MKILFIASRFPYPLLKGDQVRGYHQLRQLGQRHEIDLIALSTEPVSAEQLAAVQPFVKRIEVVRHSRINQLTGALRNVFSGLPLQTAINDSSRLNATIRAWRSEKKYDIAMVQLARLSGVLRALKDIPTVLDMIDALSLNMRRRFESDSSLLRYAAWFEWKRLERLERELCLRCAQTLVVSERDSQVIGGPRPPVAVVLGVDTELFKSCGAQRDGLLFSGNLGYFPNHEAARGLIEQIMPILWRDTPDLRLTLAGANPPPQLNTLAAGHPVTITGRVPELAPYIAKARVAVFPLRSGSGMQFKVLEAFACETPVVMTAVAAAGFNGEVRHDEHALIADSSEEIAKATRLLLQDSALAKRLSDAALKLVQTQYSWEAAAKQTEALFAAALDTYGKEHIAS